MYNNPHTSATAYTYQHFVRVHDSVLDCVCMCVSLCMCVCACAPPQVRVQCQCVHVVCMYVHGCASVSRYMRSMCMCIYVCVYMLWVCKLSVDIVCVQMSPGVVFVNAVYAYVLRVHAPGSVLRCVCALQQAKSLFFVSQPLVCCKFIPSGLLLLLCPPWLFSLDISSLTRHEF